jgi:hypothetical protein
MLIGVSGNEHSGKSTVCEYLAERHLFTRASFTAPMNRFLAELYGFTAEQLSGKSSSRNEPHPTIPGLTARKAQKAVGMCMRGLYEASFVDSLFRRHGCDSLIAVENVRFPDEVEAVRDRGGYLIRCRGGIVSDHPTETEMLSIPDSAFDLVLPYFDDRTQRFQVLDVMLADWRARTEVA